MLHLHWKKARSLSKKLQSLAGFSWAKAKYPEEKPLSSNLNVRQQFRYVCQVKWTK
jgi:hypothetical protein